MRACAGVYGIIGNLMATLVPLVGGVVMEMEGGNDLICWYFAGLMLMGTLCWLGVRAIEGGKSMLELPSEAVVETDDMGKRPQLVSPQRLVSPQYTRNSSCL